MKELIEFTLKNKEEIEKIKSLEDFIDFYKNNGFKLGTCYGRSFDGWSWIAELTYQDNILYEEHGCSCDYFGDWDYHLNDDETYGKVITNGILGEPSLHDCKRTITKIDELLG